MRFLFSTRPFYGHFHVMAAVAQAAQADGHDVAFATAAPFVGVVERSGFTFFPAGLDPSDPTWTDQNRADDRDWGVRVTRSKVTDLLGLLDTWRPDVIVREQTDFAGLLAAEAAGLPAATLGPAMFIPSRSWNRLMGGGLDRLRNELGIQPDPDWERTHAYLYLDPVPPWYQLPSASTIAVRHMVRPGLFDGGHLSDPPRWLASLPDRPTVYLTLGTVFNRRADVRERILGAIGALPVNVLCTLGPEQEARAIRESIPNNVRLEAFIPQSQLLPYCDLVISHGGFSTVMGALAHGLPSLVVPLGSDNLVHARRCVTLGLGLSLAPAELRNEDVRSAVWKLLTEPRWRSEARRRRADIDSLPSPSSAVDLLVRLALCRAPIGTDQ